MSIASGSKRGITTTVAPLASACSSTTISPMLWKNGASPSTRSPSAYGYTAAVWQRFATTARCESCTTFGSPVVPLDDSSSAMSPGSDSVCVISRWFVTSRSV